MCRLFFNHGIVANFIRKIRRLKWPLWLVVMLAILLVSGCEPSPYDVEQGTVTIPSKAEQTPLAQPSPIILASAAPNTFDDFLEEAFFAQITRDPELISELGLAQDLGMDHSQLTNVSDAFRLETYQLLQTQLDTLHSYNRSLLNTDQQLSYDIFEWYLDDLLRGQEWRFHDYPVNQTLGIQNVLIEFMTDRHPVRYLQDAQDYIHRLEQFTTKFDQLIEWLKIQETQGIIPPKFVIQRVLSQLNWYLSQDPEETALYSALVEKILPLSSINGEQSSKLFNDALRAIEEHVLPAYGELRTYFEHLEDIADTEDGFWKHPSGDTAYAYWLRHYTTLDITAEEIHQLGLQEVDRLQTEIEVLLSELAITGDSLAMKMHQASLQSGIMPLYTDDDHQAVVDEYQALIDHANQNLSDLFDIHPKAGVAVVPIEAPHAPGAYYVSPSLDGSRPGMFYVNLTGRGVTRFSMPTLAYHETIPGHHFQIAIQQELTNIPTFRTGINYTAYAEGWALYAEYLAWEAGFYADDPYGNLGRLQSELFRAVRLVVDTGIHAMGWSREQAIDYMVENVGYPEAIVTVEVERYIVMPGQATAYKVGMLKILELRQRVMQALGDDFDIKEFHNLILENGAMPLEILDRVVDDYIETKLK